MAQNDAAVLCALTAHSVDLRVARYDFLNLAPCNALHDARHTALCAALGAAVRPMEHCVLLAPTERRDWADFVSSAARTALNYYVACTGRDLTIEQEVSAENFGFGLAATRTDGERPLVHTGDHTVYADHR